MLLNIFLFMVRYILLFVMIRIIGVWRLWIWVLGFLLKNRKSYLSYILGVVMLLM